MIKRLLNLGAGVQSSAVFLMMCKGVLPMADVAVFADTQWEPPAVYEHLERLKAIGEAAGLSVVTVTAGDIRADIVKNHADGGRVASIPFHIKSDSPNGGLMRRQCTREYKIAPIDKYVRRELLGLKKGQRIPKGVTVEKWFGISFDEMHRAKASPDKWAVNMYPLIGWPVEYFDKPLKRADCVKWTTENYPELTPPRSACIGCPYHSNREWSEMKSGDTVSWADAVEFDNQIRHQPRLKCEAFLHRQKVPLDVVVFEDDGPSLWDDCEGMCGV